MAKPKKTSGWFKQRVRHRKARLYGRAGGKYSTKDYFSTKKDFDKDGVMNKLDCRPFNPEMQGLFHKHKTNLDKELLLAIKKEKNLKKRKELQVIRAELKQVDNAKKLQNFWNRNKDGILGIGISGVVAMTGIALSTVYLPAGLLLSSIGVISGAGLGVLQRQFLAEKYKNIKEMSKKLEKEGIPEKEAKKIAKKYVNQVYAQIISEYTKNGIRKK